MELLNKFIEHSVVHESELMKLMMFDLLPFLKRENTALFFVQNIIINSPARIIITEIMYFKQNMIDTT